jgi:hypothetical protein
MFERVNAFDAGGLASRITQGMIVGATLVALGESVGLAVGTGTLFIVFVMVGDLAEAIVGDYADNAILGAVALGIAGWLFVAGGPSIATGAFGLVGTWLAIDGIQHVRHGVSREEITFSSNHDGIAITGVLRAFAERLLEPFRL